MRISRLELYPSDIALFKGCGQRTARNHYQLVKDTLSKQRHQSVTLKEYAGYEGIDYSEFLQFLSSHKALNILPETVKKAG